MRRAEMANMRPKLAAAEHADGRSRQNSFHVNVGHLQRIFEHLAGLPRAKALNFSRNPARLLARIDTASSAAFFAPDAPIASVATGIPAGICTMESSESRPFSALLSTGTPSTGKRRVRGRHAGKMSGAAGSRNDHFNAAPFRRPRRISAINSGVRCAEIMRHSCATPNSVRISLAARIVSQSDLLPMMMDTSGAGVSLVVLSGPERLLAIANVHDIAPHPHQSRQSLYPR